MCKEINNDTYDRNMLNYFCLNKTLLAGIRKLKTIEFSLEGKGF